MMVHIVDSCKVNVSAREASATVLIAGAPTMRGDWNQPHAPDGGVTLEAAEEVAEPACHVGLLRIAIRHLQTEIFR